MMPAFELRRPTTLREAVAEVAGGGVPYCGGTELLAVMRLHLVSPEVLVDLKRVPELAGVEERDGAIVIGARATHAQVARSPLVTRYAGALATATTRLGNARVRATGTLAGNLCFAEPRSDVATALLALDASVELRSPRGARMLRLADFTLGGFTTARADDELMTAIRLRREPAVGAYLRFQPAEYPTVTVAVVRAGGAHPWRVVVGAVGERPQCHTVDDLDEVDPAVLAERVDVVPDANGDVDYKRHLTAEFVARAVARARRVRGGT